LETFSCLAIALTTKKPPEKHVKKRPHFSDDCLVMYRHGISYFEIP